MSQSLAVARSLILLPRSSQVRPPRRTGTPPTTGVSPSLSRTAPEILDGPAARAGEVAVARTRATIGSRFNRRRIRPPCGSSCPAKCSCLRRPFPSCTACSRQPRPRPRRASAHGCGREWPRTRLQRVRPDRQARCLPCRTAAALAMPPTPEREKDPRIAVRTWQNAFGNPPLADCVAGAVHPGNRFPGNTSPPPCECPEIAACSRAWTATASAGTALPAGTPQQPVPGRPDCG